MKKLLKLLGIASIFAAVLGFGFVACDNGSSGGGSKESEKDKETETPEDFDASKSTISFWTFNTDQVNLDTIMQSATFQTNPAPNEGKAGKVGSTKNDVTTYEILKIISMNDYEIPAMTLKKPEGGEDSALKFVISDGSSVGIPISNGDGTTADKPDYRINRIAPSLSSDALQTLAESEKLVIKDNGNVDKSALGGGIEVIDPRQAYVTGVKGPFKVTMYYGSNASSAKTDSKQVIKIGADYASAEAHEASGEIPVAPTKFSYVYKGTDTVNVYFGTNTKVARIYGVTIDQNEGYAAKEEDPEPPAEDSVAKTLQEIETSLAECTFAEAGVTKDGTTQSWEDFFIANKSAVKQVLDAIDADKFDPESDADKAKYPQIVALLAAMDEHNIEPPKSKYDELVEAGTANGNLLIAEDFAGKAIADIARFGGTYGKKGVYHDYQTAAGTANAISGGKLTVGNSSKVENNNSYAIIDFGPVTGTIEGCFTASLSQLSTGSDYIMFYDVDNSVVFNLTDKYVVKALKDIETASLPTKPTGFTEHAADVARTYHFTLNLETGAMTLNIDDKEFFSATTGITSVSGIKIATSNGGARKATISEIAICGTEDTVANYAAKLSGLLEAKKTAMTDETDGTHKKNADAITAACSTGTGALTSATTIDEAIAAYKTALSGMTFDKDTDIDAAVATATASKTALDAKLPTTYTSTEASAAISAAASTFTTATEAAKSKADANAAYTAYEGVVIAQMKVEYLAKLKATYVSTNYTTEGQDGNKASYEAAVADVTDKITDAADYDALKAVYDAAVVTFNGILTDDQLNAATVTLTFTVKGTTDSAYKEGESISGKAGTKIAKSAIEAKLVSDAENFKVIKGIYTDSSCTTEITVDASGFYTFDETAAADKTEALYVAYKSVYTVTLAKHNDESEEVTVATGKENTLKCLEGGEITLDAIKGAISLPTKKIVDGIYAAADGTEALTEGFTDVQEDKTVYVKFKAGAVATTGTWTLYSTNSNLSYSEGNISSSSGTSGLVLSITSGTGKGNSTGSSAFGVKNSKYLGDNTKYYSLYIKKDVLKIENVKGKVKLTLQVYNQGSSARNLEVTLGDSATTIEKEATASSMMASTETTFEFDAGEGTNVYIGASNELVILSIKIEAAE